MSQSRLEEIRNIRISKLAKLRSLGIDPYPPKYTHSFIPVSQAVASHGQVVNVVGRLWRFREHGSVIFADLKDSTGQIQLLFQRESLAEKFSILKLFDVGDFIGVEGKVITTTAGQISIDVNYFELLGKSLRPLPEKNEGLEDTEERFRRRYLDILTNDQVKDLFIRKSQFWEINRQFLKEKGFVEVETPILEHVTGGGDAKPFITHHNALDQDFYLRISTELYLKRLVGAGFDKVFTLGPNFRNEGIDDEHLPEYYQIEWYWAYANYRDNMQLVIEIFRYIAQKLYGKTKFTSHGHTFDLSEPWLEIDYAESIKEKFGVDIFSDSEQKMRQILDAHKVVLDGETNRFRLIDNLWKLIRKEISGPAFLVNEPKFMSPLAKSKPENLELTQRFHIVIAGSELGNGYSELNDPIDQLERFKDQQKARDAGDDEAQMLDIDYVEMLEYGMPPTTGYAHSERLFWFLEAVTAKEGTLFPQLRYKVSDLTKQIYNLPDTPVSKPTSSKTNFTDFCISEEVSQKFPGITFAYTKITGVSIAKNNSELEQQKRDIVSKYKLLTNDDIQSIFPISIYRQMLKDTGVDYHSRRPSPEALLRRLSQGKDLYNINTAVDAYNLAVIETGIGLGGFDLQKVTEPVVLRLSLSGEEMHLLGDDDKTKTKAGEIVYADAEKLLTLDLNYRDIDSTKITENTKDIILFADGGPGIDPQDVITALKKGAMYIQQYCGGEIGEINLVK